jgi:hypothetical protein
MTKIAKGNQIRTHLAQLQIAQARIKYDRRWATNEGSASLTHSGYHGCRLPWPKNNITLCVVFPIKENGLDTTFQIGSAIDGSINLQQLTVQSTYSDRRFNQFAAFDDPPRESPRLGGPRLPIRPPNVRASRRAPVS